MSTKKISAANSAKVKHRRNAALDSLDDDAVISADEALKLAGTAPVTLGSLVRTLRRLGNKTQSDVAEALGVSVAFLSAIERGDKALPPRHARALSKVLSYSEEVILEKILEHVLVEVKGRFEVTVRRAAG
jgi:DNA-binding XRE family transcriptional regulator